MIETLTTAGYEATKQKLADLEERLARLAERNDVKPNHREDVKWSYKQMISQYTREIKLYEAQRSSKNGNGGPQNGTQ